MATNDIAPNISDQTYQIKPSVGESFKATKIREIIDGVLTEVLTG